MAFNRAHLAKTSGFQSNCGLNSIIHAFCDHIVPHLDPFTGMVPSTSALASAGKMPMGAAELLDAYNEYYELKGSDALTWTELFNVISGTENAFKREVLLGPVFRSMLKPLDLKNPSNMKPGNYLEDLEIVELANSFNITLESYDAKDDVNDRLAMRAQFRTNPAGYIPYAGYPQYTLQLRHTGANHWEYAESDDSIRNAHNAILDAEAFDPYDAAGVKLSVQRALRAQKALGSKSLISEGPFDLSPAIVAGRLGAGAGPRSAAAGTSFEHAAGGPTGTGSLFGDAMAGLDPKFAKVFEGVEKIIGTLFGSSTSNPTVKGFIGVLVNLFKGLMLFKALLPEFGKIFNPDGADAKGFTTEQLRNPAWAKFDTALQKLSEKNPKVADALRQEWLNDEKGREMSHWMNLAQALSDAGLVTDANLILKQCERAALDSFAKGKGKEGSGAAGSVGKGEKVDDLYREDLEELQDPDLDYASKAFKRENIQVRLQLLDNYYKGRAKIEDNLILARKADGSASTVTDAAALRKQADEERAKLDGALHSLFDGHKKRLDREREIAKAKIAARLKGGPAPAGDDSLRALT